MRVPAPLSIALAVLITAALGAGSCGGGGGGGGGGSSAPATGTAGQSPTSSLVWLRGDLHAHTSYSDGIRYTGDPPWRCIQLADHVGLDFWAITDHRTHQGTLDPNFVSQDVILIPGEEYGSKSHGNALGITLDIADYVDKVQPATTWNAQVQAVIDDVHAQGALFIANHPTNHGIPWVWDVDDLDGIEVWNAFWALHAAADIDEATVRGVAGPDLAAIGHDPAPELLSAVQTTGGGVMLQALRYYEAMLASGHRLACVGGTDRHVLVLPGMPTTHVGVASVDLAGVLEGIRRSRTYVTFHYDGPEVTFVADGDGDGVFEATMGDAVTAGRPAELLVRVSGTPGGRIELRRSGLTIAQTTAYTDPVELRFVDTPLPGDWYRVDFYEPTDPAIPGGFGFLTLALSPTLQQGPEWGEWSTWLTLLGGVAAVPGLDVDASFGTTLPTLVIPAEYSRLLNADPREPSFCMAAVTSPIYVDAP